MLVHSTLRVRGALTIAEDTITISRRMQFSSNTVHRGIKYVLQAALHSGRSGRTADALRSTPPRPPVVVVHNNVIQKNFKVASNLHWENDTVVYYNRITI